VIFTIGLVLSTFLSIAMIAAGYLSGGMVNQAFGLIIIGLAWMAGQIKWKWVASIGLSIMTLAAALGLIYMLPTALMVGGFLFAFITWDLMEFKSRIKHGSHEDQLRILTSKHFIRLGLVLALGFAVVALTRFIRLRFNFEMAVLLTLVGVWGLSLLVGRLRREE
jgi:hypothetical protein